MPTRAHAHNLCIHYHKCSPSSHPHATLRIAVNESPCCTLVLQTKYRGCCCSECTDAPRMLRPAKTAGQYGNFSQYLDDGEAMPRGSRESVICVPRNGFLTRCKPAGRLACLQVSRLRCTCLPGVIFCWIRSQYIYVGFTVDEQPACFCSLGSALAGADQGVGLYQRSNL